MIRCFVARFTLLALVAAACGPSSDPVARDATDPVAQARARAEDLANSSQNYQPVRFVSEIERVRVPKPVTRPEPDTLVREGKDLVQAEAVVVPAVATQTEASEPGVDSTTETASAPRVPSIVPRDAPTPTAVGGTGNWRSPDPGPDLGTVIGVVLRGGRVDPGHCPRHPRPPSQIPHRIPR